MEIEFLRWIEVEDEAPVFKYGSVYNAVFDATMPGATSISPLMRPTTSWMTSIWWMQP